MGTVGTVMVPGVRNPRFAKITDVADASAASLT